MKQVGECGVAHVTVEGDDSLVGVAIVFVAHQLAVIAEVADRVAVMNLGRIVEMGDTAAVFHNPQDDYTVALLDAVASPTVTS